MNRVRRWLLLSTLWAGAAGCATSATGGAAAVATDAAADLAASSDAADGAADAAAAADVAADSAGDLAATSDATDTAQGQSQDGGSDATPDAAQAADAAIGTKACYEIVACVDGCPGTSDPAACKSACLGQGTAAAQAAYQAVAPCFATDAPACKQAYVACIDPVGEKSCNSVVTGIAKTCMGKPFFGCAMTLGHDVRPDHAPVLAAMAQCLFPCITSCANDSPCLNGCINAKCAAVINVCVKQPVVLPP